MWFALALAIFVTALVVMDRRRVSKGAMTVLAALVVLSAAAAIVEVALTGHSGSVAVWRCVVDPQSCSVSG